MYRIASKIATVISARITSAVLVRVKAASLRRLDRCLVVSAVPKSRENRVAYKNSHTVDTIALTAFQLR